MEIKWKGKKKKDAETELKVIKNEDNRDNFIV